jgi:hypothetical protein
VNTAQRVALWLGIGSILLMGVMPPWRETFRNSRGVSSERPAQYAPLWNPPERPGEGTWGLQFGIRLDTSRLLMQWSLVGIITIGAILTVRRSGERGGRADDSPRHDVPKTAVRPAVRSRIRLLGGAAAGLAYFIWAVVLFTVCVKIADWWYPWPDQESVNKLLICLLFPALWLASNRLLFRRWWL